MNEEVWIDVIDYKDLKVGDRVRYCAKSSTNDRRGIKYGYNSDTLEIRIVRSIDPNNNRVECKNEVDVGTYDVFKHFTNVQKLVKVSKVSETVSEEQLEWIDKLLR